jgi:hypothetical protein
MVFDAWIIRRYIFAKEGVVLKSSVLMLFNICTGVGAVLPDLTGDLLETLHPNSSSFLADIPKALI